MKTIYEDYRSNYFTTFPGQKLHKLYKSFLLRRVFFCFFGKHLFGCKTAVNRLKCTL